MLVEGQKTGGFSLREFNDAEARCLPYLHIPQHSLVGEARLDHNLIGCRIHCQRGIRRGTRLNVGELCGGTGEVCIGSEMIFTESGKLGVRHATVIFGSNGQSGRIKRTLHFRRLNAGHRIVDGPGQGDENWHRAQGKYRGEVATSARIERAKHGLIPRSVLFGDICQRLVLAVSEIVYNLRHLQKYLDTR